MQPTKLFCRALLLLLLANPTVRAADEFPMVIVDEFKFGAIVPNKIGSCIMAFDTGLFTNDFTHLCPARPGTPGFYYIVAPKNTLMRVTLPTYTHPDNYYSFVPKGEINNRDGVKKTVNANTTAIIDSGTSGVLELRVGGTLNVLSHLSPSTDYTKLLTVDIEATP